MKLRLSWKKQTQRESLTLGGAIVAGDFLKKQGHILPMSLKASASKKLPSLSCTFPSLPSLEEL